MLCDIFDICTNLGEKASQSSPSLRTQDGQHPQGILSNSQPWGGSPHVTLSHDEHGSTGGAGVGDGK